MALKKINIVVAGATGYVGLELINLLSKHPNAEIKYLCATKSIGKSIKTFDKRIKKKLPRITNLKNVKWNNIDLVFLSLPNGEAQKIVKKIFIYKHIKFIDLSADFRLLSYSDYKKWYKIEHSAKNLIKHSIYSISEFVRNKIKKYRIIANPGCYPTSIQLPLIPLIKKRLINLDNIIIDSKSGYSGAGKNFEKKFKHKNLYSSIYAYNVNFHRHMSELDQEFNKITYNKSNIKYTFNPHLLPMFRGILTTIHLTVKKKVSAKKILNELKKYHSKNKFIKIHKINKPIGTGDVINSNLCEISVCESRLKGKVVVFSSIDNLVKGASGQAIQNMNLIYNINESRGLE